MALTAQGGGGGFLTPGGQSLVERYGAPTNRSTSVPTAIRQQQQDPFDMWENHFQRTTTVQRGRPGSDELSGAYIARNKKALEEARTHVRDRQRLAALAKQIGVDPNQPGALGILWLDAVDEARTAAAVDPGIASLERGPWEILESWAKNKSYEGRALGKEGKSLAGTRKQVQRNINFTDPTSARAIAMDGLRSLLDRDPTEAEIKQFMGALRGAEQGSPAVTTTTSTTDEEGNLVESSSTTEGGVEAGAFAETFLRKEHDAEADAVRAGQEYFNAAQQLSQAVV